MKLKSLKKLGKVKKQISRNRFQEKDLKNFKRRTQYDE